MATKTKKIQFPDLPIPQGHALMAEISEWRDIGTDWWHNHKKGLLVDNPEEDDTGGYVVKPPELSDKSCHHRRSILVRAVSNLLSHPPANHVDEVIVWRDLAKLALPVLDELGIDCSEYLSRINDARSLLGLTTRRTLRLVLDEAEYPPDFQPNRIDYSDYEVTITRKKKEKQPAVVICTATIYSIDDRLD